MNLDELYNLISNHQDNDATDMIFNTIDVLFIDKSFNECDKLLKDIDVRKLSTKAMRSFLVITYPAKEMLPSRQHFFCRVKNTMIEIKGIDETNRIVGSLE